MINTTRANTAQDEITILQDGDVTVSKHELLMMFEDMNHSQKIRMSSDHEKLVNLLTEYLIIKKKVKEAKKKELDKQELIKWKLEKINNRILSSELINNFRNEIQIPINLNLLAQEYYDASPEEFTTKEQIKVSHILLSTSSAKSPSEKLEIRSKLDKLAKQIKAKEINFEDAAKQYSEDKGSAKSGGVINYFPKGKMVKPFEKAAFNLKNNGDISEIIETQFGYHLIQLIDRKPSRLKPFEEVKDELIKTQANKYLKSKTRAYNDTFLPSKEFKINNELIEEIASEIKESTPKVTN